MIKTARYIFLIVAPLFLCCHKDSPSPPAPRLIPAELRAYWDFQPGTWWAYKDSAKGTIDTVKVLSRFDSTFWATTNTGITTTCEYWQMNTYNTGDKYNYDYWINTIAAGTTPNFNTVFGDKFNSTNDIGTHNCFVYPFEPGISAGISFGFVDDVCTFQKEYQSYNSYSNVVEMTNNINWFEGFESYSFFAQNIGLVRYDVPDSNKVKTLINYHINP